MDGHQVLFVVCTDALLVAPNNIPSSILETASITNGARPEQPHFPRSKLATRTDATGVLQ